MTTLRTAAQKALEAMESAEVDPHSSDAIHKAITTLKEALVEDAMQKFTDVNQELEAALAEPVQEPVKFWPLAPLTGYYDVGGKRVWLEKDEPFPHPTPPQRKPLSEEEIQAAWDSVDMRHPRGNETRIAFARAVERAHGIGGQP